MITHPQTTVALVTSLGLAVGLGFPREMAPTHPLRIGPPRISANDNRRAAGVLRDGKLELRLEVVNGEWYPESDNGPSLVMQAFAEEGRAPEIPGPMIRVPLGTQIHITLHNALPDSEVVVHGLHTRPAATDDIIKVPPGATREKNFLAGAPGTYFYWATSTGNPLQYRVGKDSQLSGVIIVDPLGAAARLDRSLMIGLYSDDPDSTALRTPHPRELVVVNGKSWPHTEQFTFNQGDSVLWRVINVTGAPHPMHLHGFYFNIERSGAEGADTALSSSEITQANTRVLVPGTSMMIRFVPDRPGNWLFHCHLALHVDGKSTVSNIINRTSLEEMDHQHLANHGVHEMAGLIVGIHVLPRGETRQIVSTREPLSLRLLIQNSLRGYSNTPGIGFVLQQGAPPQRDSVTLPGPTLFLERGRQARITVVNNLKDPTAVHWHGMEIDSYPDGVPGWSGTPGRLAPQIQPADSFIAVFTPPRAGTFVYHSHMNELMQTNSGMYGVLMVTDSVHRFDPRVDKIILVGGGGPGNAERRSTGMVNGSAFPQLDLIAGSTYRLHIVQIHPQANVSFRLGTDTTVAQWTPVAKDGADLPAEQSSERAAYTLMGAGETAEFLFTPRKPGLMKMNIQTRGPGWQVPLLIFVRPPAKGATN